MSSTEWIIASAIVLFAGLSGSVPYAYIIGKSKGVDIREHGSGNVGATNAGRVLGRKYGYICFVLDLAKGLVPALIYGIWSDSLGRLEIDPGIAWMWVACAALAVLGHVFTPWLGFKGGKGVATGLGSLLAIFPALTIAALVGFVLWYACLKIWKYVSLASIVAAASMPGVTAISYWISDADMRASIPFLSITGALAALVIVKHMTNIKRLLNGTESKVKPKAQRGAEQAQNES